MMSRLVSPTASILRSNRSARDYASRQRQCNRSRQTPNERAYDHFLHFMELMRVPADEQYSPAIVIPRPAETAEYV